MSLEECFLELSHLLKILKEQFLSKALKSFNDEPRGRAFLNRAEVNASAGLP